MAPRFKTRLALLLLLAVVFLPLASCSDDDEGPTTPIPTGVFLDGAVEGLGYSAGTKSGLTDAAGTFQYVCLLHQGFGQVGTIEVGESTTPGASPAG